MSQKLNFRSVVSLVIGSQIGSGIFLLPASLALLGPVSLLGWLISGAGAILLALVFAQLSMQTATGGGPHVYVEKAFGRKAAFFTAWTYWLISWISSITVIVASIGYLSPLIGVSNPLAILALEIGILASITLINMRGAALAGSIEVLLTVLKCAPLIVIPIAAFFFIQTEYFHPFNPSNASLLTSLNTASLMTFWGFIGIETATTTAAMIDNPKKTIPRAVISGTLVVVAIYLLNSVGIMGVVAPETLTHTQAPYVDAAQVIFGNGWTTTMALIAFIACIGTLNAWVLTSGQIALEAAKQHLFPPFFAKTNRSGAPYMSLLAAFCATVPILCLTTTPNILAQINIFIDVSVTTFILIYLACTAAYLKIAPHQSLKTWTLALGASGFCLWILLFTSPQNLLLCPLFILSGVPIYFMQKKNTSQTSYVQ